jgi:murein DD-endopeptidase MepM/ murein hydrolase activator NlpD
MALLIAFLLLAGLPNPAGAAEDLRESFDLQVPQIPAVVTVEGGPRLVYELHFTNFARDPLALQRVDVLDSEGGIVASMEGDSLAGRLGRIDAAPQDDLLTVAQGARRVLYVEIDLDGALPKALVHRVAYAHGPEPQASAEVRGGGTSVRQQTPPVLGPPLRGGPWVAIYGPSWERGHRRVLYTVDGRARIPGRFAVDWMLADGEGRFAPEGSQQVESAYGYGAEVLAVADALVVAARDGVPEAGAEPPRERALPDAAGNYVVLRLDDEHHIFYEHLAPGSIRVAPGERVHKGQMIAAVGSTGSSRRAHLHFHVADRGSPLGAEGLPFALEGFSLLGSYTDIDELGNQPWTPRDPSARNARRRGELPAPNVVLTFDDLIAPAQ